MNDSVGFVAWLREFFNSLGLHDEESISPFTLWESLDTLEQTQTFMDGFIYTLQVSVLALLIAAVFSTIGGVMATSRVAVLRACTRIYVEIFQNTPLVIQISFLYYGLPHLEINLDLFTIGALDVGAYHGAYVSEVVRSGILAAPRGRFEASASQGFTYTQQMHCIIVPQTIKIILPPMSNQMVNLIKDTSVLLIVGSVELMSTAGSYAVDYGNYASAYIFAAFLYFIVCHPLAHFAKFYEEKLKRAHLAR